GITALPALALAMTPPHHVAVRPISPLLLRQPGVMLVRHRKVDPVLQALIDQLQNALDMHMKPFTDRKSTRLNSSHAKISRVRTPRLLRSFPTRRSSDLGITALPALALAMTPPHHVAVRPISPLLRRQPGVMLVRHRKVDPVLQALIDQLQNAFDMHMKPF